MKCRDCGSKRQLVAWVYIDANDIPYPEVSCKICFEEMIRTTTNIVMKGNVVRIKIDNHQIAPVSP